MIKIRNNVFLFIVILYLFLSSTCAESISLSDNDKAVNIADIVNYKVTKKDGITALYDKKYNSRYLSDSGYNKYIEINSDREIYNVYIRWMELPGEWFIQIKDDGKWIDYKKNDGILCSELVSIDGLKEFRIISKSKKCKNLSVFELELYTKGVLPNDVQVWENNKDKRDIMLFVAHPDDELIFFGGLIPRYSQSKNLQVAYMTFSTRPRRYELLNGLWHCGLKNYPSMGNFQDVYSISQDGIYRYWSEKKAIDYAVNLIRTYRPDVVVTHDIKGEYGHGAHKACADIVTKSVKLAMDKNYKSDLPVWNIKKLYLHLGNKNTVDIEWDDKPLNDGRTSLEIAKEAFRFHESQQGGSARYEGELFIFDVVKGGVFDNSKYSLIYSSVGEDKIKNDFFENIED